MKTITKKQIFAVFVIWLFWLMPIAFADAVKITDVKLDAITDSSSLISWKTDEKSNSILNYGKQAPPNQTESSPALVKEHRILAAGLDRDTDYYYEVISSNASDNNKGVYYQFRTSAAEEAPLVMVELEQYTSRNKIDIRGRTEINTIIEVYINNALVYKTTSLDGNIVFYNVDLTANRNNTILIRATDSSGKSGERSFWIVSDTDAPQIRASAIPEITKEKKLTISGNVSEISVVDIIVNSNPVYSKEGMSFSASASLDEGNNTVTVRATDRAGNAEEISKTVFVDTQPPKIENISPKEGSFYYEGKAKDTISGTTEPFAKVILYYKVEEFIDGESGGASRLKIADTTADDKGYFEFKNINFESPMPNIRLEQISAGEAVPETQEKQKSVSITLYLEAKDRAGFSADKELHYLIGTCWSGEIIFDIDALPEYQRPSLMSPERLKEGTEVMSFVLNLTYTGDAEKGNWQIMGIDIEKACGRSAGQLAKNFQNDHRYNISCRILPSRPDVKDSNNAKTLWFVEYKRLNTASFVNFTEDFWKEIADREMIFPLKITVKYKEREYNSETRQMQWSDLKYQTKCIAVSYVVDIPIDPRKVLPDWLIEGGIKAANRTIQRLDEFIPKLENVIDIVGISCIAAMVSRLAVKIYRIFVCKWEIYKSKLMKDKNDSGEGSKCPVSEKTKDKVKGQLDLTAEELKNQCPGCSNAWNAEANVYQVYRWTCDRIFCHVAPAGWTQTAMPAELLSAEVKSRACSGEDTAGVNPLVEKENCYKEYSEVLKEDYIKARTDTCYQYGNDLYVADKAPDADGVYTLTKATIPKTKIGTTRGPETLQVIKQEGSSTFATSVDFNCAELCKRFGKEYTGTCMKETECSTKLEDKGKEGFLAGYTKDCWLTARKTSSQCCCYYADQKAENKDRMGAPANWNYREQQIYRETNGDYGYWYPDNIYTPGRDRPACFGQSHLFDYVGGTKNIPSVDPFKDQIPAFQCLCLTGIRARLLLVKSIMAGFANCFQQIKTTGTADAGVCKEMFTMYVCDLMYQIFTWFRDGCIPLPFGGGIKFNGKDVGVEGEAGSGSFAEGFKIGLGSIWDSVKTAGSDLEAEYGETTLGNYLSGGEKAIARKICLAAFGFDVGLDMDSILDMTYNVQFKSTVGAFGARRDFLTYNPSNGLATYEYRSAWSIFPGCDIEDYSVDLVCVNLEEKGKNSGIDCSAVADVQHGEAPKGCNCLYSDEVYQARSKPFFRSTGEIKSSMFTEGDEHKVFEDRLRYDHLRFKINLKKGFDKDKCFPEGHEDGIFYFPITDKTVTDLVDCYVDQRGLFRCTRGIEWESRGEAWLETFSSEECQTPGKTCQMLCYDPADKKYKDCNLATYQSGDAIKAKLKVTGKKSQCIYLSALNEKGEQMTNINKNTVPLRAGEGVDEDYSGAVEDIEFVDLISDASLSGDIGIAQINGTCKFERMADKDLSQKTQEAAAVKIIWGTADGFRIETSEKVVLGNGSDMNPAIYYPKEQIKSMIIYINGVAIRLTDVEAADCSFVTKSIPKEQRWKIHAELRYTDADGQCDTNAIDTIGVIGRDTSIDTSVRVYQQRPSISEIDVKIRNKDGNFVLNTNNVNVVDSGQMFKITGTTKNILKGTNITLKLLTVDPVNNQVSTIPIEGKFQAPSFEYNYTGVLTAGREYDIVATAFAEGKNITGTAKIQVAGGAGAAATPAATGILATKINLSLSGATYAGIMSNIWNKYRIEILFPAPTADIARNVDVKDKQLKDFLEEIGLTPVLTENGTKVNIIGINYCLVYENNCYANSCPAGLSEDTELSPDCGAGKVCCG